jgi:hypothetical protein
MPSITSFYYAIFKKLQITAGGSGSEHLEPPTPDELSGGFSLKSTTDPNGIKGTLSSAASIFAPLGYGDIAPGMSPLAANDTDPTHSPLFMMLSESLKPSPQDLVNVNGKNWPCMPPPWILPTDNWTEFNPLPAGNPNGVVAKLGAWISAGQIDDAPKNAPYEFGALKAASQTLKAFNNIPPNGQSVLFVCSKPSDDGRRAGDTATPAVPVDHVPPNFWDTAWIDLTDTTGKTLPLASLGTLAAGAEYYVAAVVGNAGAFGAGREFLFGDPKRIIKVTGHGLAFNTHMSPDVVLPPLSNLNETLTGGFYEEYSLPKQRYGVVGFRFNVDQVFAGLAAKISADPNFNLGGAPDAKTWLKGSHACVKIMIESGEATKVFPVNGDVNYKTTLDSDPRHDRHIAQKNLVAFDMNEMAAKKIWWKNFIVSQAGKGLNELVLEHDLPAEAFRFYVAMPTAVYQHYVAKQGHKGFDQVREIASRPFPDCVILRQSVHGAELRIAEHARERYLGLSIGIEVEATRARTVHTGDVRMVHRTIDRRIAGGFTVRLTQGRAS